MRLAPGLSFKIFQLYLSIDSNLDRFKISQYSWEQKFNNITIDAGKGFSPFHQRADHGVFYFPPMLS